MNALKSNAPILVFVLVLGVCGYFAWSYNEEAKSGSNEVKNIKSSIEKVDRALKDGVVADEYAFSQPNADKIKNNSVLKASIEREKKNNPGALGINVVYPQPMRPKSNQPELLLEAKHIFAYSPNLSGEAARADHGKVYVFADLPKADQLVFMEPVRIEVFRGVGGKAPDLTKPYTTIELGLEDPPAPKAGGAAPPPPPPPETRVRGGGGAKPPPPPFKLGDQRAIRDTNVEQQTEYSYQMRMILRFTNVDGKMDVVSKPDNTKETTVYHAPKLKQKPEDKEGMVPATPMDPNTKSKLYATDYTPVVKGKTPSNFELRMAGVNGSVPPEGSVRNPDAHDRRDYSVNFEVRVWLNDLKDWKVATLNEMKEGDQLAGKIQYRAPGAKENTVYDFTKDLGYKLFEVNNETVEGPTGAKVTTEVAQLENQRTKAMEKLVKSPRPPSRAAKLDELDKVIDAQEKEIEKKRKDAAAGITPAVPAAPTTPPAK